jgi:hypothetical protein
MTTEFTTMPQVARMRLADSQAICRIPSSISAKSAQKSKSRFPIDRLFDTNADETHTESTGIVEA